MTFLLALTLAAAPEVALLSSRGAEGELRFQPLGAATLVEPAVRFSHGEGSDVKGSLLPGTRVVVASATTRASGDLSYANALLRLEAGRPARVLAEGLAYGSRPLVTPEGRVFVSRGVAGPAGEGGRVDALTVDEVDVKTAKVRTVYAARGYLGFLVGALGRELVVYEVNALGARLVAVHVDTLAVRVVLAAMAPMARDFVLDAPRRRVLFTQVKRPGWCVDEVSLLDGATRTLAEGPEVTLIPTVLADGRVLISAGEGRGLVSVSGGEGLRALGPGFERVRLERGGLWLVLHERPGEFPLLHAVEGGRAVVVPTPEARLDVAGVAP